ncbi:MAG TPA: universal stress protein [Vicinamibacterales bacterium]|jgi:nucleotide-binding universal stress UspA family protein
MWKCPPSTVLVPVDFGEASARALAVASALASRVGARIRVLHAEVIEAPPYFTHEQLATIERERKAARAKAVQFVLEFARAHGVGQCEVAIAEGSPTAAIVQAAGQADLVVMGTHGRHGPGRWWMGSVAERVVHDTGTPVLVVRADLGGLAPEQVFDRPLVIAPQGAQGEANRMAAALAQAFGGQVVDTVVACEADLAQSRHATLMVVSKAGTGQASRLNHTEHWLRSCALPMLFVPSDPVSSSSTTVVQGGVS